MVAAPALMGYVMRLLRRIIKTQNGILPLPIDNDDDDDDDDGDDNGSCGDGGVGDMI